jgi:hypothetical protein
MNCWGYVLIFHIIANLLFLNNIISFSNNVIHGLAFGDKYFV